MTFKREERYFVIKKKTLSDDAMRELKEFLWNYEIDTVECVVVESDWPIYEKVWKLIEEDSNDTRTSN